MFWGVRFGVEMLGNVLGLDKTFYCVQEALNNDIDNSPFSE